MKIPKLNLKEWIEVLSKYLSFVYIIAILVTVYDVISDVIFRDPTVWVYDVVTTLIAVAFLIGGSYALGKREHIRITSIYDHFSSRNKLICDLFTSSFTILYLITFSFFAFKMASISVMNWELGGSVWQQPTPVVVKVSLFIGGVLMILQAISNILEDLQSLKQETGS